MTEQNEPEKTQAEQILETGIQSVTSEGTTTVFRTQEELSKIARNTPQGRKKRPMFLTINLSHT